MNDNHSRSGTVALDVRGRLAPWQTEIVAVALIAAMVLGRVLAPSIDQPAFQAWATVFVAIVVQSTPFLLGGVLIAGLISVFLSERMLARTLPRRPAVAVPVAGVAGIGLPGCECAAVPIAAGLIRRGVVPAVALTFLLAAPAVNPAVLVSTAVAFPGRPEFVVARFGASMATALLVGWWCLSRGDRLPLLRRPAVHQHGSGGARFVASVRHDFLHAAGFLVLGAGIAAAVSTLLPRALLDTVAGNVALGILAMAIFAFVVAICSEADAFVAASLTAFSDTAKLVFLVVGPAMDVKLASMEAGQFGASFARQFVPVVLLTAVGMAVVFGAWLL